MTRSHRILAAIGLLLLPLLASYGCGTQPPVEEPKLAQAAMDQAKTVQADKLASLDWGNAMAKMKDAELMVKKSRNADAKTFYLQAKSRFENAYKIAKDRRDGLVREVDEARSAIASNYSKLKAQVARARGKAKKDGEASCAEIEQSMADMDKAVTDGDVIKAKLMSKDIGDKIYKTALALEKS